MPPRRPRSPPPLSPTKQQEAQRPANQGASAELPIQGAGGRQGEEERRRERERVRDRQGGRCKQNRSGEQKGIAAE